MIPESHPLQKFFLELVGRHYAEEIGIRDPQIVTMLLTCWRSFARSNSYSRFAARRRPATDRRR